MLTQRVRASWATSWPSLAFTMHVVLDTNIFFGDFSLGGEGFRVLVQGLKQTDIRMRMPQTVFDEVVNKYREELSKRYTSCRNEARRLAAFRSRPVETNLADDDEAVDCNNYERKLRKWCVEHGVRILKYPRVTHQNVVKRELARRRPFKQGGSGYRDYLIWLTILGLLKSGSDGVYFITANSTDFLDAENLHPELAADLEAAGVTKRSVRVFRTLSEFNEKVIVPGLQVVDELGTRLRAQVALKKEFSEWIRGAIRGHVEQHMQELKRNLHVLGPDDVMSVRRVVFVRNVAVQDIRQLSHHEALVTVHADSRVRLHIVQTSISVENGEEDDDDAKAAIPEFSRPAIAHVTIEPFVRAQFVYDYRRNEIESVALELSFLPGFDHEELLDEHE